MSRNGRIAAAALWVALMTLALTSSAPTRPDQTEWILRLLAGQWDGEEPLVVALFNGMGLWPFVLAAQTAPWLRGRPVPLWPFALLSLAVGAYVFLPGLVLHGRALPPARWQRAVAAPAWRALLAVAALALAGWGALAGHPAAFAAAFRGDAFVHAMTLDFCALWAASILVARERGGRWWLAGIPILGGLAVGNGAPEV